MSDAGVPSTSQSDTLDLYVTTDADRVREHTAQAAQEERRWLWLPGLVAAFLLQHALQVWCPPIAVFRRMGIRTRREIAAERYALKSLRGDFDDPVADPGGDAKQLAERAIEAAAR